MIQSFAQEDDTQITQRLAQYHQKQAEEIKMQARHLAGSGDYLESVKLFENAAEQYSEAATYYRKLHDYINAAKFNGRSSLAYEEASIAHGASHNLMLSEWFSSLSDEHNSKALHDKGLFKFGDQFVLPPKHQIHMVDDPHDIKCKESFELIFKATDGSPACVKLSSVSRLMDMG